MEFPADPLMRIEKLIADEDQLAVDCVWLFLVGAAPIVKPINVFLFPLRPVAVELEAVKQS